MNERHASHVLSPEQDIPLEAGNIGVSSGNIMDVANAENQAQAAPTLLARIALKRAELPTTATSIQAIDESIDIKASTEENNGMIELLEVRHYAKRAPHFEDQVRDKTRTNTFSYINSEGSVSKHYTDSSLTTEVSMTEHEGLGELDRFLDRFNGDDRADQDAKSLKKNLTFIGEKEYEEAARGLAAMWKAYLDADPKHQICVLTQITESRLIRKSDDYLLERIINTFTDEELVKYSGRIVDEPEHIDEEPENVRLILLDDWIISGSQMEEAYRDIYDDPAAKKYLDSVEINTIVVNGDRAQRGLEVRAGSRKTFVPVIGYFRSHDAPDSSYGAHVTGTHSSVDFDFEWVIDELVRDERRSAGQKLLQLLGLEGIKMPPLTNIKRRYRSEKSKVNIEDDRIEREDD